MASIFRSCSLATSPGRFPAKTSWTTCILNSLVNVFLPIFSPPKRLIYVEKLFNYRSRLGVHYTRSACQLLPNKPTPKNRFRKIHGRTHTKQAKPDKKLNDYDI